MKTTTKCGRCNAGIDIEEGLKIATCLTGGWINKPYVAHSLEVDPGTDAGADILAHIEKKPVVQAGR